MAENALSIPLEKLGFIVVKAREYDAEIAPTDGGSGSYADGEDTPVLEATRRNPILHELRGAIDALNDDERTELVALMWLGRGDFEESEWGDALHQARQTRGPRTSRYLVGTPLLPDYLEEGASRLGISLEQFEG